MQRRVGWWKWVVWSSALAGCFSRTDLEPVPGGEAGAGDSGSGGAGAGSGSMAGGKAGSGGKIGGGGASPGHGSAGKATGGHGPAGGSGTQGGYGPGGGSGPHGGSGGSGGECSSARACGGDITGTWTVASSCLDVAGSIDLLPLGLGCGSAPITGSRAVAGTFIANADGTYVDNTTTSGEDQIDLPPECLNVSGTVVACERIGRVIEAYGYDTATCAAADGGRCLCDAVFAQSSALGVVSYDPSPNGTFTTSGNTVTLDDGSNRPVSYEYCASTGQVVLRPINTLTGTLEGTVVLTVP